MLKNFPIIALSACKEKIKSNQSNLLSLCLLSSTVENSQENVRVVFGVIGLCAKIKTHIQITKKEIILERSAYLSSLENFS